MKCSVCGKEIETTFLNKINGSYYKEGGKLKPICSSCFREKFGKKQNLHH
ncbi:MAG: hypothetical protein M1441_01605 [Candidatus Parvarchaeota archaeon]|nr:hypothetical protein [Candidatus Parvarchaeota archaeon]